MKIKQWFLKKLYKPGKDKIQFAKWLVITALDDNAEPFENFLSLGLRLKPSGEYFDVIIQRVGNKTTAEAVKEKDAEIEHLTALVPKIIVPELIKNLEYRCSCLRFVGMVDYEFGGDLQYNYCPDCGAKMDWDNIEVKP